jgi:hypothetical protein
VTGARVIVTFQGYALEIRQEEGGDTLYGAIEVLNPIKRTSIHHDIPVFQTNEDSNRTVKVPLVLYEGPPAAITVIVSMNESDAGAGSREMARTEIRNACKRVLEVGVDHAVNSSDVTRQVIDEFATETGVKQAAQSWLEKGADAAVEAIFGMSDDPYNPGVISISASEMMQIPPVQQYSRQDDPSIIIDYTHRITIQGRDHEDDIGQIALLFLVKSA